MPRALPAVVVALLAGAPVAAADTGPDPVPGETRSVVLVGNNWEGTTDVVDPFTLERLDRVDVIPDRAEREAEIMMAPDRALFFRLIRDQVGEGHNQYNDDVFSSHDGRTIFVSRPSYADVVAIDLRSKEIVWRTQVEGYRSDHMAISPDGTRLLVSASTGNVVHQIDTATGKITGHFDSGDSPHENNYSEDGSLVYHASIGRVFLPSDSPEEDRTTKGRRVFHLVDADTLEIRKSFDMGRKLEEAGFPDMSSAVRPMALSPDERHLYFQVSFFHGFVEFDLQEERVLRIAELPISEETKELPRSSYLLDSAHHGLAMNPRGTKLCVAGTMSDYAAIVHRTTLSRRLVKGITKPYWSTNSHDGRHCYVSGSGDDAVFVISYRTGRKLAKVPVGFHPQRVRNGVARLDIYPQAGGDERFRLAPIARSRRVRLAKGTEGLGCRAAGARALRLASCVVRVRAGGRDLAVGERIVRGRRGFLVDVDATPAGRRALAAGPVRATLVVAGTDAVGRRRTVGRPIVLRAR
jgi:DNA-binding beta-propeller fold protein YncE